MRLQYSVPDSLGRVKDLAPLINVNCLTFTNKEFNCFWRLMITSSPLFYLSCFGSDSFHCRSGEGVITGCLSMKSSSKRAIRITRLQLLGLYSPIFVTGMGSCMYKLTFLSSITTFLTCISDTHTDKLNKTPAKTL